MTQEKSRRWRYGDLRLWRIRFTLIPGRRFIPALRKAMPVNYATPAPGALFPVSGVRLCTAEAGIRKQDRRDLTLIELSDSGAASH